jgi:rfaE bifunctional protein nucleotidyltransferase chain/domain
MKKKIYTLEKLLPQIVKLKNRGKVIVTTNGSFDLIHYGHIFSLKESKKQGDILIVGINSDNSVKKYKSDKRPIITEKYRAKVIASIEYVDYVFIFNETNPIDFIEKIKPNIHTNSIEYGENCIEKDAVIKNGGKLYLLKKYKSISTTKIINKILNIYK